MSSNVHELQVSKKSGRRGAVTNRQRASVVPIVEYRRPQTVVETPEQKIARLEKLIDTIAYHLLTTARLISAIQP